MVYTSLHRLLNSGIIGSRLRLVGWVFVFFGVVWIYCLSDVTVFNLNVSAVSFYFFKGVEYCINLLHLGYGGYGSIDQFLDIYSFSSIKYSNMF